MNNRFRKIYTITVLTLPILSQYKSLVPGFSVSDLMLLLTIPFVIFYLLKEDYKINVGAVFKSPFFWFILYIICGSMLSSITQHYASMTDIAVRSIRYIFYIFCATFVSTIFFDFDYFIKGYKRLAIFVTLFIIIQTLLFQFRGYVLMGTIPGLKVGNPGYSEEVMRNLYSYFYRPSSIFLEPGYHAQFMLPYLAYTLFNNKIRASNKLIEALFLTIGIILSTSGQGILIGFIIWVLYFITRIYNFKTNKINTIAVIGSLLLIMLIPFLIQIEIIQKSLNRLFGSPVASSTSRIFRGYAIFEQLEPLYKIIGVGYGNVGAHITYKNIYTAYDAGLVQSEYMNSIAYILVNLGVIGFILMTWIFIYLWDNTKDFYRTCVYILILLSGVSTYFIYSGIVFYLSIILSGFIEKDSIYKSNHVEVMN